MQYGVVPGGGTHRRTESSHAKLMATHLAASMRRPSRFRRQLMLALLGVGGILIILGRRNNTQFQYAASTITTYMPDRIANILEQYAEFEETRWDDDANAKNATLANKPKFHLLIPAQKPSASLCKTLLSAAVLNYPPPTLLNYGGPDGSRNPGTLVNNTLAFLLGREAHDDDLIMVVEQDAWFQLPAQVTISRFFHGMRDSSHKLVEKYGRVMEGNSTNPNPLAPPKYTQRVLFGAAKTCTNSPADPACLSVPQSPLPKDIYGKETDKGADGALNRPRFMASTTVMGRVADLRPIYEHATLMLEYEKVGKQGSQYIISQIFGEQEYARALDLASSNVPTSWRTKIANALSKPETSIMPSNVTLQPGHNYEFGIGLDYHSSIFQVMNNSAQDIHFLTYNSPLIISSPSTLSKSSFKNPLHLPLDLSLAPPPYQQHIVSSSNPNPPITQLDTLTGENGTWADVELATNIIVPGSSVPASLNFNGISSESGLTGNWNNMWFFPNARALMRQYIRSPDGPIAAEAAIKGGSTWWDLRGGKGGMWSDRGEWLEWNEVCGAFDAEVFGDGKGQFGKEKEEDGGSPAVEFNKFGAVVAGKATPEEVERKVKLLKEQETKAIAQQQALDEQEEARKTPEERQKQIERLKLKDEHRKEAERQKQDEDKKAREKAEKDKLDAVANEQKKHDEELTKEVEAKVFKELKEKEDARKAEESTVKHSVTSSEGGSSGEKVIDSTGSDEAKEKKQKEAQREIERLKSLNPDVAKSGAVLAGGSESTKDGTETKKPTVDKPGSSEKKKDNGSIPSDGATGGAGDKHSVEGGKKEVSLSDEAKKADKKEVEKKADEKKEVEKKGERKARKIDTLEN